MADYLIKDEILINIADTIRDKILTQEPVKPEDMASGVNEVYEAGEYNSRLTATKCISKNGFRRVYQYSFQYSDWGDYEFVEGYIKPITANYMFYLYEGTKIPKGIDCSKTTQTDYFLTSAQQLKYLPDIGIPASSSKSRFAQHCYALETIEIFRVNENTDITNAFQNCTSLKNIIIEGVLGGTISFSWSPLSVASMKSIITHLKNYAGTTSDSGNSLEYKYTLTLKASCVTELETADFTDEDKEWLTENGMEYTDELTWTTVIDNLKWNLVSA